nr:unnamed protein product [Digitaria exilis]
MAALSISTPTSSSLLPPSRQVGRWTPLARSAKPVSFSLRSSPLAARAAAGNAPTSPVVTELDAVASFSEIVPDTVVFDDFEKFAPTAATVSSSLLLGIAGLPNTKFKSAIDTALADGECNALEKHEDRMSCYLTKALANVGAELAHQVPGRVSTEIDARLAYDTQGIIQRFRTSSGGSTSWCICCADICGAVAALKKGEDAGLALAQKVYAYIHRNGYKTKLMAAAIRNKQDSLDESVTDPDVKYSYVPRLTPAIGKTYDFTEEELVKWDQLSLAAAMGPAAEELLASGLEGYANQARRVEELFQKIWPPPNV